jgi:hypothetical protein
MTGRIARRVQSRSLLLILRSPPAPEQAERSEAVANGAKKRAGVSKDEAVTPMASWFETAQARLLTMRREFCCGKAFSSRCAPVARA